MKESWIWPLSWYLRIKALEAENFVLRTDLKKARDELRAESFSNAIQSTMFSSALMSALSSAQTTDIADRQRIVECEAMLRRCELWLGTHPEGKKMQEAIRSIFKK